MNRHLMQACAGLAFLALAGIAQAQPADAGRQVYERHCRTCHGGTAAATVPLGPSLAGIVGAKAGTRPQGVHSRAVMESGTVWDRAALRRFLAVPRETLPAAMMPEGVADPVELESLLDYLESLR